MSSQLPPNPYFNGINFNPSFFSKITDYLTEAIANSKYLRLIGGILSGNLGIKTTPEVELDVNGKVIINNGVGSLPANGRLGSNGTRLILFPGTASEPPYALGYNGNTIWYGAHSSGNHTFYSGTNQSMMIRSNGNVGIGTTDANGRLELYSTTQSSSRIILSGQEFYEPSNTSSSGVALLCGVNRTGNRQMWIGDSARLTQNTTNPILRLQTSSIDSVATDGVTPLNFSVGNSLTTTTIFGSTTLLTGGNVGVGTISPQARLHLHNTGNNQEVKLSLTDNTTGATATDGVGLMKTDQNDLFIINYEATRTMLFTANAVRLQISATGNVGIGATAANNILQVGDGGRLRISNSTSDYTLIGSKETDDNNNTSIIISGNVRTGGKAGDIEYKSTSATGAHIFYINGNSTLVDWDVDDCTFFNSITTNGANFYTDGEYLLNTTKRNTAGTLKVGYFLSMEWFYNSMINIAFSHNDSSYTFWHGHIGTNNDTAIMYITALSQYNTTIESFQEQTTNAYWIYFRPTSSYNASVQLRVKFFG